MESFLRKDGFEVVTASDGQEAVEAVERERPQVVLMDMDMPVMDGYEATRLIRTSGSIPDVTVIALTGSDDADAEARCLSAGCSSYLRKPIQRRLLLDAVRQATGAHGLSNAATSEPRIPVAMARMFVRERQSDLERAALCLGSAAFSELARIGHQLKGSSATLGFEKIGNAGAELERAALDRDASTVEAALRMLRDEVTAAEQALPRE